jgi:hypothetical protein
MNLSARASAQDDAGADALFNCTQLRLVFAASPRHCERSEAIQLFLQPPKAGLLRR